MPRCDEFVGKYVAIGFNDQAGWRALATISAPADFVVFSDATFGLTCGGTRTVYGNACASACTKTLRTQPNTRHQGGENLVFADGHAKWYKAEAIGDQCGKLFLLGNSPRSGLPREQATFWNSWP
jgi:prepilin-type processing-associated H-X9-DG protein